MFLVCSTVQKSKMRGTNRNYHSRAQNEEEQADKGLRESRKVGEGIAISNDVPEYHIFMMAHRKLTSDCLLQM